MNKKELSRNIRFILFGGEIVTHDNLFQKELIDLEVKVHSEEELFQLISKRLEEKNWVNSGYFQGLVDRERKYPTGLATQFLNIAIPHCDTQYIERPFIYVVRTTQDLTVRHMGLNEEMKTDTFLFLGIKEPSKQVVFLSLLMDMFQDSEFVLNLRSLRDEQAVYHLFIDKIVKSQKVLEEV
ncbi:MAG: PTS sugar transporter subunit IIA [Lactobacillales bacterium]|jgi:PTS system galactitol-specific IIA component|nr:PTS sugar transporter subunit IIA [Lactobacillales bacterium]